MTDPMTDLGPEDAERLLDLHRLPDRRHAAVAVLLAAATAPARPHELAGEEAAVAGYRRVFRPTVRRRRCIALVAMATAVLVPIGGTAYAAGTGQLPDPIQRTVHSLLSGVGVPAPDDQETGNLSPSPSQQPSPGRTGTTSSPGVTGPVDLCRAWLVFQADPRSAPVTGTDRRELARAAGSDSGITDYCRKLVGAPSATPRPGSSSAEPSNPATPKPGNPSPGVKKPDHNPPGHV
ncbi:hypothetical protein GCM10010399_61050 [Dactylosporangium fulvum]|uniref:Uncharacterized protein n=1 Tax=Dactylosporangium fulvum TaxID=53359 RepID=A0ABY5VZQ9_9ACTN|nr:hypothetical protein [Dactylosporangium fulvum]UWP83272.1 hypothetical protein Dfulv_02915 [Dactylosporangium fulvum]